LRAWGAGGKDVHRRRSSRDRGGDPQDLSPGYPAALCGACGEGYVGEGKAVGSGSDGQDLEQIYWADTLKEVHKALEAFERA